MICLDPSHEHKDDLPLLSSGFKSYCANCTPCHCFLSVSVSKECAAVGSFTSLYPIEKDIVGCFQLLWLYFCLCVCVSVCHMQKRTCKGQMSDSLEVKLHAVASCWPWVLGTELWSSVSEIFTLNCWAITSTSSPVDFWWIYWWWMKTKPHYFKSCCSHNTISEDILFFFFNIYRSKLITFGRGKLFDTHSAQDSLPQQRTV